MALPQPKSCVKPAPNRRQLQPSPGTDGGSTRGSAKGNAMTEVDFTGGRLAYRGLRVECDRLTRIARHLAAAGGAR
jgi:hypothetical protein